MGQKVIKRLRKLHRNMMNENKIAVNTPEEKNLIADIIKNYNVANGNTILNSKYHARNFSKQVAYDTKHRFGRHGRYTTSSIRFPKIVTKRVDYFKSLANVRSFDRANPPYYTDSPTTTNLSKVVKNDFKYVLLENGRRSKRY